ncbi:mechanosensitive ion channel family protein [Patescibacteria group bacterium]|nr:mechanosensitive ion channel family protein [Patescibacteria group bacterium]MBU1683217.1 mechanosensitive ion channel family protein [Patescibacteria group bacterium]MBU1934906.1 mechanosensitive ion channel family protein [Patescibacteria group bacterium]
MFEKLIPTSYAQFEASVSSAASAGKDLAVEEGQAGIQGLLTYVATNLDNWIAGIVIVFISYIVAKMAAKAIKEAIIKEKGDEVQESALILVERITTITILIIGITIALAINGLNFTAVIGALSLGIGFALKDIIGNFISGVIMLSQDRIRIGDFIKVEDILGTIVSIDTRATILQAIDGTEVVIPNQTMLGETLISYSTNPFRRIDLVVGVDYKTNLPMVTSLIKGIIDRDKDIVPKPEALILVDEFGDSSINIKIRFWIESSKNWQTVRSNLANKIKKAFDELDINIPFPIRTLKLDEDDRSFLKTMDSMKKGKVPEVADVPKDEELVIAAANTAYEKEIPYDIFKENQKVPNPAANIEQEPEKEQAQEQAEKEGPSKKEKELVSVASEPEEQTPPPTHL